MTSDTSPRLLLTIVSLILVAGFMAAWTADWAEAGKSRTHKQYLPPKGKLFAGVSDTGQTSDFRQYRDATKAHPAVIQSFESWGKLPKEAKRRWEDTNTRGMLSLSTARCYWCAEEISPRSIARGKGDRYILALSRLLLKHKAPTYIRLFPEMNGHWNAYSAFHGGGSPRDAAHSTKQFRKAWQRFVLITSGGKSKEISKKLRKLGMPKIKARVKARLPKPKVAFAWVPQSTGSPNVPGNRPAKYFPGWRYVDWVGADIYAKYPNFAGLNSLYKRYDKRPFLIGEWAPWDRDNPAFVNSLFDWMKRHKRARMAVYYQDFGEGPDNVFEIRDYPLSRAALRHRLNSSVFSPFAPGENRP